MRNVRPYVWMLFRYTIGNWAIYIVCGRDKQWVTPSITWRTEISPAPSTYGEIYTWIDGDAYPLYVFPRDIANFVGIYNANSIPLRRAFPL